MKNESYRMMAISNDLNTLLKKKKFLEEVLSGKYDYIINSDIEEIKNVIEAGNLPKEDALSKLNLFHKEQLLYTVILLKKILAYDVDVNKKIEEEKTNMTYSKNDVFVKAEKFFSREITYSQALELIDLAKKVINDKRIYLLLDFYLKNEELVRDLLKRQDAIMETEKNKEAYNMISMIDNEFGIIVIDDSETGRKVVAGTRKDIILSNFLGVPFPKDIDKPGFDYGPHNDFYSEPHKITKTFYSDNLTETQLKMIEEEKKKREKAKKIVTYDDMGFINGLVISRSELTSNGFDPQALGWKPLKVKSAKTGIFKLCRDKYRYKCSMGEIVKMAIDINKQIMEGKSKK